MACVGDAPESAVFGSEYNSGMDVPTFYLETSVWGSLAPRQPRDRKQVVSRLLSLLDSVRGTCVISVGVLLEVAGAAPAEAGVLRGHIDQKRPIVFPITEAVEALAQASTSIAVSCPSGAWRTPCTSQRQPAGGPTFW